MFYFILLEIQPLTLPSHKERVLELRIEEVLIKITGYYLFPVIYIVHHYIISKT